MKRSLNFLCKTIAILVAISSIIFSIAIFRYEIEEFFEFIGEKVRHPGKKGKSAVNDEYADFADV